jgi:hypothetical protein
MTSKTTVMTRRDRRSSASRRPRRLRIITLIITVAAVAFPFAVIAWFGNISWVGRAIAVGYLWICSILFGAILAWRPGDTLITKQAKLARPEFAKQRVVVEAVLRLCLAALAVYSLVQFVVCTEDVIDIARGGQRKIVQGQLVSVNSTWLTWWCFQSLTMDSGRSSYSLFFYPSRLRIGFIYRLEVLPRSNTVVLISTQIASGREPTNKLGKASSPKAAITPDGWE